MALIYDGIGQQYVPIARNVSGSFSNPWVVFIRFSPIQQNIISARGICYVFKNLTATSLADFFAIEQPRQFNDRNAHIMRFNTTASDIITLTPFYDFTNIKIWTEPGTGL